jgi:hypothetical protein
MLRLERFSGWQEIPEEYCFGSRTLLGQDKMTINGEREHWLAMLFCTGRNVGMSWNGREVMHKLLQQWLQSPIIS